jgi:pimeloyl-ACP methyl ester carboxylesterase
MLLVDSAGIRPPRTLRWYWKVGLAKVGKYAARLLGPPGRRLQRMLVGRASSADYAAAGALRPTLVRVVNEDLTDRLPRVACPTLLVWGARDEDTPLWMGQRMEELIPDAGLVVFEGAGHYAYADEPQRFGRIAREFLGAREPR